jgi:hypothetical protein
MKKRTRLFLVVTVGLLVLGLGTGLLASYVGVQNFSIIGSDGPEELAYVPADARFVAFADVHDVVNSELRQKFRQFEPTQTGPQQFENETGINVERDIDHVLAAAWANGTPEAPPLVLAHGRFDEVRIEGLIREHGGTVQDYKGKRLLAITTSPKPMAVAFVEPGLVAAGDINAVQRAIDTKLAGHGSATDNAELMKLIKDADSGNAWAVARFDALTPPQLPKEIVQQLPPINWFSATGRVDSGLQGTLRAEAKDEKSAQDLREVIRGFMALARLQAGQRAEFADLVNSLELGGQGTTVTLGFSVPAQLIDSLGKITAERRHQIPGAPGPQRQAIPAPAPASPSL